MKKITILLLAAVVFASCNNYGKKVKISDKTEVFIQKDATEEDAKTLGNYLEGQYKADKERSFQLIKENNAYTVKMVVDENELKKTPSLDVSFMALRFLFKTQVFKDHEVNLILTDNKFKDFKTIRDTTFTE